MIVERIRRGADKGCWRVRTYWLGTPGDELSGKPISFIFTKTADELLQVEGYDTARDRYDTEVLPIENDARSCVEREIERITGHPYPENIQAVK